MKVAVRYYTKSGNAKKLADAIAMAAGVTAESVSTPITEKVDILFLGSSVYAAGVAEEIKSFISELDSKKVGFIVNFSTAALLPSTYKQVSKLLANKNIALSKDEFHCRGSFGSMHKGRPNDNDLKKATEFAKKVLKEMHA